jgi:hypothetical protein
MPRRRSRLRPSILLSLWLIVTGTSVAWAVPGVMREGWIACASPDLYTRARGMVYDKDWTALAHLIADRKCIQLKAGQRVEIESTSWLQVRLRVRGRPAAWWTGVDVIDTAP